ncbi:U32 family peptidase [Candidatus Gracilibacteria bacterium]|nr:U32 family peptidase [Candidatus Gracilibacteria bacterium]
MKSPELLAPVGSYEALHSAISAGCDAVYFGITHLNMRAGAVKGFDFEDLKKIVGICHKNNIRAYLTVNTIIYDTEMELMEKVVNEAKKNKIDAIIASDVAVLQYCHEIGQEVHCSTQLSISNTEAV